MEYQKDHGATIQREFIQDGSLVELPIVVILMRQVIFPYLSSGKLNVRQIFCTLEPQGRVADTKFKK